MQADRMCIDFICTKIYMIKQLEFIVIITKTLWTTTIRLTVDANHYCKAGYSVQIFPIYWNPEAQSFKNILLKSNLLSCYCRPVPEFNSLYFIVHISLYPSPCKHYPTNFTYYAAVQWLQLCINTYGQSTNNTENKFNSNSLLTQPPRSPF